MGTIRLESERNITKHSEREIQKKREKMQRRFWNEVNAAEPISIPELENAVEKEFRFKDDKCIQVQIALLQTEARIRTESKAEVWIGSPNI